jgi:hypothetical protein
MDKQTLTYRGRKYEQTKHAVYCKKCQDTIESIYHHDFKYCSCKSVGIDGGTLVGNSYVGNPADMELRDEYVTHVNGKIATIPQGFLDSLLLSGLKKIERRVSVFDSIEQCQEKST